MAVPLATDKVQVLGPLIVTAVTPVAVNFQLNSQIKVHETALDATGLVVKVEGLDYTLTGAGKAVGGSLTWLTEVVAAKRVTIFRDPKVSQDTDYVESDKFPADAHEDALDKLTFIAQRFLEENSRAIRIPLESDPAINVNVPPLVPLKALVATADGLALDWSDIDAGAAAAAAASAVTAATSETNAATSETNAATSETNAATSETNAATSETNAGVSETNAAASAAVFFASGTRMLFQQTAAPTGWTKEAVHNDKALRLVTGTVGTGGSVAFATALATPALAGSTASHVLAVSEMPAHTHDMAGAAGAANVATTAAGGFAGGFETNTTGGGGGHTHTNSGTVAINVQYVDFIIAVKD